MAQEATHKKYLSVRRRGKREVKRMLDYYNLDRVLREQTEKYEKA